MSKTPSRNASAVRSTATTTPAIELILDDNYVEQAIACVNDAKKQIRICAYAWRWYSQEPEIGIQRFNIALLKAKLRGVNVFCIVDTAIMKEAFSNIGFEVLSVAGNRMLHTKAICVDEKSLIVGSHNLTKRANTDNYEVSVLTQEYEPIIQFIDYFDKLWICCGQS